MKGQASLESLWITLIILSVIGLLTTTILTIQDRFETANTKTKAIAKAKQCAGIVDALFSNSGGKPKIVLPNCVPAGFHQIQVTDFNQEKNAFTIAHELKTSIQNNQTILEVITPDHYE